MSMNVLVSVHKDTIVLDLSNQIIGDLYLKKKTKLFSD